MTVMDVAELLTRANEVPEFDFGEMANASIESVKAAYNGCGPERWPEYIRDYLDEKTQEYAPAVMEHDFSFTNSDGTEENLERANARFRHNINAIFSHDYPLFTWRMLNPKYRLERAHSKAVQTALCVGVSKVFTRQAWREANAKRSKAVMDCGGI